MTEPRILIENLYPGANYQIKVFAVSHGLRSEPHVHMQAVCKLSPTCALSLLKRPFSRRSEAAAQREPSLHQLVVAAFDLVAARRFAVH